MNSMTILSRKQRIHSSKAKADHYNQPSTNIFRKSQGRSSIQTSIHIGRIKNDWFSNATTVAGSTVMRGNIRTNSVTNHTNANFNQPNRFIF